ncbi:MAG TPA: glucose-6-phosphate isomerase, partial [Clostridiales bacterium]|nr:glucose-6-phosphate isomerase [Clostridiales bacterium]
MKNQQIRFDYNNMMSEYVGEKEGISVLEISTQKKRMEAAYQAVQSSRGQGMMGWTELPYNQEETVNDIIQTAKSIRKKFDYFVVLGIGGSALGPMAVFQALCHLRHNELPKSKRRAPKFYVEDNVDPERMSSLLDVVKLEKTMFNVITKSGSTSETMSQFLIIMDLLKKKFGSDAKNHIIATTSENKGNLIKIARAEGLKTFYIPDGVGGRFSELSPVGLLPAAVLGINIKQLLRGAALMDRKCKIKDYRKNPALMAAVLQYIAMKKGKNISVMMPYADSLKLMADWYCQLWGESLGKSVNRKGEKVHVGQTPVKALGVTDQHSQIQLYTEGPFDKVICFLAVGEYRAEIKIPKDYDEILDVSFLGGYTLNELMQAELKATEYAITKAGRLNQIITLPVVNAYTIGQLFYFFEMQTAYCGEMLDINAFDQPGVEEGKNSTYALMGKKGYE